MFWLSMEWSGVILGLLGAYLLANKSIEPTKAWTAWLISDLILIALFGLHTGQYGLLFMHLIGAFICIMGFFQWKNPDIKPNKETQKILFKSSFITSCVALLILICIPFSEKPITNIEWFGSLLSISGGLLMASNHRFSPISWISWTIANFVILLLTVYTQQWGLVFLQAGYTLLNIYGCYTWIYKKSFFGKLLKVKSLQDKSKIQAL